MKWICAALLCGLLSGCAAIEAENDSNDPIPPPRADPFGGYGGSGPGSIN